MLCLLIKVSFRVKYTMEQDVLLTVDTLTNFYEPPIQTERFFMLQHFDVELLYFSAVILLCLCSV